MKTYSASLKVHIFSNILNARGVLHQMYKLQYVTETFHSPSDGGNFLYPIKIPSAPGIVDRTSVYNTDQ